MRYVWDRFDDYFGPGRVSPAQRLAIRLVAGTLRRWDVATAARVHHFLANSAYVAARIRRYYGREAEVIPPPIDTEFFTPGACDAAESYDLIVSALVPYKRIDLALRAYAGTGRRLLIAGSGPERQRLEAQAPAEARFLGRVSDEQLRELYRGCRAVLLVGVEDFGMVPLEAMACGRPAVVFAEGGAAEAVVDGESGLVFSQATPEALRATVDALASLRSNTRALRAHAERYSRQVFEDRIREAIAAAMSRHQEMRTTC
jgi:glycosyltransferase involved in cell wall biosynthesis